MTEETLQNIYGIGPVVAKQLILKLSRLGLIAEGKNYTEKELRSILKDRRIFDNLHVSTKVDLLYLPIKIIPRDLIHIIDGEMRKYLRNIKFDIAGSYRREKPYSRDVDIVISKGRQGAVIVDQVINILNRKSKFIYVHPPYARGLDKATVLMEILVPITLRHLPEIRGKMTKNKRVRVKVDIFICEPDEYIFTLMFATGSGDFNVRMRSVAKRKGYLLNQRGLYKKIGDNILKKIPIKNEKKIFEILNIEYKTPDQRIK
jgi:DNA polymerase/3'-5' exonuclease PolX